MAVFDLSNDAWAEVVAAGNPNGQEITVQFGIAKIRVGSGDRVFRIGGNEARSFTAPAGASVSARPDGPRVLLSTGDVPGAAGGAGASVQTSTVPTGQTGVVYSADTGLKAPITVTRDSGSTALTFAADGTKVTVSIAASLAVGASLTAIAKAVGSDGAFVGLPITITGASATPTPSPTPGSFEGFKATGSWTGSDARVVTGTTGMASVVCIQMDQPFTEVQLDFFNPDITAPSQMDSVEVFTSASAANAVPTGSPVTLTFGGVAATSAAPIMVPAGTQGAATTGTPASDQVLANRQPGHLASDSVPLVSVPRTDGGAGYLLYIRVRTAGAFAITNTSSQFAANYATGWMGISGGRDFKNWTLVGSSTWATRPNASDALTAAHLCVAARTKTTARALNVLSIGDSIRQGFATNTGFNSALRNAKRLNTAVTPIAVINAAIASSQSASMVVNAKKWIDFFKPDVVLVPAFTGNDMPSATPVDQALLDASYARAMEVVTYAQAAGAKVIIDLPIPYSRFTAATEPLITTYRQRWKTAGFTCFDAYNALGDGATPQAIQSQYSADNTHPNDAGHAVGGGILLPLLNAEMVARGMPTYGGTSPTPLPLGSTAKVVQQFEASKNAMVFDFLNDKVTDGATTYATADVLTSSRAQPGYVLDRDGGLSQVAANTPRRTNRGLLVEASRVQSVTSPVNAATWGNSGGTIANIGTNGPFQRIEITGTQNFHRRSFATGVTGIAGVPVAVTVWYEPGTSGRRRVTVRNTTKAVEDAKTAATSVGGGGNSTGNVGTYTHEVVRQLANGMQEYSFIFTSSGDSGDLFEFALGPDATSSGTIVALGAQIEKNSSFASSLIPSQMTRPAEGIALAGAAAAKAALGGTVVALTDTWEILSATGALPNMADRYIRRLAIFPTVLSAAEIKQWGRAIPYQAGVNLAGPEFSTPAWPSNAVIDYYLGKGFNSFRMPFKWAKMQPDLNGELDTAHMTNFDRMIQRVTAAGARATLDCHNYMRRGPVNSSMTDVIGVDGSGVTKEHFADLWRRIALRYKDNPLVHFELMNEPSLIDSDISIANQNAAIAAIRAAGAENLILVGGNSYGGAHSWGFSDNGIKTQAIVDPLDYFAFDTHQYLDSSYGGVNTTCVVNAGSTKLAPFVEWARRLGRRGWVGETSIAINTQCVTELNDLLTSTSASRDVLLGYAYWVSGGAWPEANGQKLDPADFSAPVDKQQMAILQNYLT